MTSRTTRFSTLPTGLLRWILRLPIVLYRVNLGWLFGGRFVLLKHIGRKTGRLRKTVVEVVGHDVANDCYYIVSGWGYNANWYRNLVCTPSIDIQVGRRKLAVSTETLSPLAGAQVLLDYRKKHPLAARELSRLMGLNLIEAPASDLERIVRESLPVIALRPRSPTNRPSAQVRS
ncbi:MAG: nitroreductase family deazaflavin-dependent oxidoreductase [Aggregatilineales bacterium]